MRILAILGFSLLLVGCSLLEPEDLGEVTLTTGSNAYAAGEDAEVRLENTSGGVIEFGALACVAFERHDGNDWVLIESLRVCTANLHTLQVGEALDTTILLDASLVPGRYRLVHRVYRDITEDEGVVIYSNPFEIRS
ncbi:MAG: hypothetical protein HKN04_07055 [Rhodothermaceae bacterium]|nr:hypothetical protein [Rhodothermaceae bacterium]